MTSRPAGARPPAARATTAARWMGRHWLALLVTAGLAMLLQACFPWQRYSLAFDGRSFDFLAQQDAVERCLDRSGVTVVAEQSSLPPTYDLRAGLGEADELASCLRPLGPGVQLRRT